jgi:hypothetical protein
MNEADKMTTTGAAGCIEVAPDHPDAELVRLCAEALAARRAYNAAVPPDDEAEGPAFRRMVEADAKASALPAATMEGVLALAHLARACGQDGGPFPGLVVESLLALGDAALPDPRPYCWQAEVVRLACAEPPEGAE